MSECVLMFAKFLPQDGVLDEQDLSTAEFARRLKERTGWNLIGVTVSDKDSVGQAAREIYARGADLVHAISLRDKRDSELDIYSSGVLMKNVIERYKCRVNVMGERSSDISSGALSGYVAALARINYVRYVRDVLDVSEDEVTLISSIEGEIVLKVRLPAMLVPIAEYYPPRPISIKERLEARKKTAIVEELSPPYPLKTKMTSAKRPELKNRLSKELVDIKDLADLLLRVLE